MLSRSWSVEGVRSSTGASRGQRRLPCWRDPRARRGERVREIDIAGDRQWLPRSRRGHRRGRRDGAPQSFCGREPQARPRHRLSDVLARVAPDGGRESLPRGTVRAPTDLRTHEWMGGRPAWRLRPRHLADRARGDALARGETAPRGRQGAARRAEGVAPRRADDGARARGRRPSPRAGSRAEPRRRRDRLRQPPPARGPRHRRPDQRSPRRRGPGDVRGRLDVGGEPRRAHDRASARARVSAATRA